MGRKMTLNVVFVGGPIQYAINGSGQFNGFLKGLVERALTVLDSNGYMTLSAHRHEGFGELDVSEQQNEVCLRDRKWMEKCDCFVAILPSAHDGTPIRTEGTAVELGWASALRKKIIIIHDPKAVYSHLIAGLESIADVTYLNTDEFFEEPLTLVRAISASKYINDSKRDVSYG